jgi:DNA repair exonuclease SbcCD ATPase subunit
MIPQRIAVRGFLCYRDEQEINLDGASVWLLAGLNGSGKSAVFDAVTYALFGGHRGGMYGAQALINKHSDRLAVEFDFLLDGQLYQARRTLKVTTKGTPASTQQIRRWKEPAGDNPGCWEAVPDTNQKTGFDRWVRENLGLTYETFTSSVLLMQGKAEKLLAAAPKERFEVLAGIVGLDRYRRLHERADEKRRTFRTRLETLQHQLNGLREVSDAELADAEQKVLVAQQALEQARTEVDRLQSLSLALPLLRRLHREREKIRRARADLATRAAASTSALVWAAQLESELAPQEEQVRAAIKARQTADRSVTRANTLYTEVRKRREQLRKMAGEKTCSYCGQALSPQHVQAEEAKLQEELTSAEKSLQRAERAQGCALSAEERLQKRRELGRLMLLEAQDQAREQQRKQRELEQTARVAAEECLLAYRELSEPFRSRVSPEPPADWLSPSFPTQADLEQLQGTHIDLEPDQLRKQLESANRHQTRCADQLRQAQTEKAFLENQRRQRQQLQSDCLELDRQHKLAHNLAELLGRQRLQLYLVRQAERGIVAYANAILDRLSGGQLYLHLCEDEYGGEADQALQLEAYNRTAGQTPIGVSFLSGSQRFRVAVSLALGIGQYASRLHRPIESVIIDEGFGCLDKEGRQVMIQELQNLRGQLRCILLVSHQEEFADAFAAGYRFELRDGTTTVSRFQR